MPPRISEHEQKVIKRWLVEDDPQFEAVFKALEDAPPSVRRATLVTRAAANAQIDANVIDELTLVLFNLAHTITNADDRHDIISEIFRLAVGDLADAEKLVRFEDRVNRFLRLPSVAITSKAQRIIIDNPKTFCRARTLSEVRPIFAGDGLKAEAAVIVHQLKIVFHSGPDFAESEIFISLDREDLDTMKKIIDRAIVKHSELLNISEKLTVLS